MLRPVAKSGKDQGSIEVGLHSISMCYEKNKTATPPSPKRSRRLEKEGLVRIVERRWCLLEEEERQQEADRAIESEPEEKHAGIHRILSARSNAYSSTKTEDRNEKRAIIA